MTSVFEPSGNKYHPKLRSAFSDWLDGRMVSNDDGSYALTFNVREDMLNPFGTLHGGLIAAIIMESITGSTHASQKKPEEHFKWVNFHTEFLGPVRYGTSITAQVKQVRQGRSVINTHCSVYTADNMLVAKGSAMAIRE